MSPTGTDQPGPGGPGRGGPGPGQGDPDPGGPGPRCPGPGGPGPAGPAGVYQQVGTTSSSFIGPACRPAETTEDHRDHRDQVNNNNIEQSLSDFYRELETLDLPDSAAPPPGQHAPPPGQHAPPPGQHANRDQVSQYSGPDRKRRPQPDWQHWDPDHHHHPPHWDPDHHHHHPRHWDPYHHHQDPKRPRSSYDASWRPHPPQNRPPFWGHPGPRPPPPPWFSGPFPGPGPRHCVPRHVNPDWAPYPHHPQDSQSDPPDGSPPPSMCPPGCGPSDPPPPPPTRDRWGGGGPSSDPLGVNGSSSGGPDAWRWGGPPDPTWPQSSSPPETKPVDLKQADDTTSQDPDYTTSQDPDYTTSQDPDYPSSPLSLILMRGLPGSGKSTTARELACTGPSGLILSTDDYFLHADGYQYEPGLLSVAHHWNQNRADEAMLERRSPLIIDNTNLQAWEMKPYVTMALERGYSVYFQEPDTAWKFDPAELEKRNKHGVPQQKISQMLDRFCFPVSVETVMSSQEPPHASGRPQHQRRRN